MLLRFTKMHGLGNDFVVFDLITQTLRIDAQLIRRLADRRLGIGCDQVLVIEPPTDPEMDFRYRIFNQDGTEVLSFKRTVMVLKRDSEQAAQVYPEPQVDIRDRLS